MTAAQLQARAATDTAVADKDENATAYASQAASDERKAARQALARTAAEARAEAAADEKAALRAQGLAAVGQPTLKA
eukprot:7075100-Pyramimonas_sp.AAC.1